MQEMRVWLLGWEDPLEEEMATSSSILAGKNPMNRVSWQFIVHGIAKSQIWPSDWTHTHVQCIPWHLQILMNNWTLTMLLKILYLTYREDENRGKEWRFCQYQGEGNTNISLKLALSPKETSSSKRGSLQQARWASVYEFEGRSARKDLKNHLFYQLTAARNSPLRVLVFWCKAFFFFPVIM